MLKREPCHCDAENNKARPVLEGLLKKQDDFDVVIHGGDLAYARGRQGEWDAFGRFMQPLTSRRPMQVAVGNQEEEERADDDPPCDADGNCPKRKACLSAVVNSDGSKCEVSNAYMHRNDHSHPGEMHSLLFPRLHVP